MATKTKLAGALAIMAEIREERARQVTIGYGAAHDDALSSQGWAAIRGKYENRQLRYAGEEQRRTLVKIAAVTIAQLEALDREEASKANVTVERLTDIRTEGAIDA